MGKETTHHRDTNQRPIMAYIYPKPMNIFNFAYDITGVSFSYNSSFVAIYGGEGLVILEYNKDNSIFVPIRFDKGNGYIAAVRWDQSNYLSYLTFRPDRAFTLYSAKIEPSTTPYPPVVDTSFTFGTDWKLDFTKSNEDTCDNHDGGFSRIELGTVELYFATVSSRSVRLWEFKTGDSIVRDALESEGQKNSSRLAAQLYKNLMQGVEFPDESSS